MIFIIVLSNKVQIMGIYILPLFYLDLDHLHFYSSHFTSLNSPVLFSCNFKLVPITCSFNDISLYSTLPPNNGTRIISFKTFIQVSKRWNFLLAHLLSPSSPSSGVSILSSFFCFSFSLHKKDSGAEGLA